MTLPSLWRSPPDWPHMRRIHKNIGLCPSFGARDFLARCAVSYDMDYFSTCALKPPFPSQYAGAEISRSSTVGLSLLATIVSSLPLSPTSKDIFWPSVLTTEIIMVCKLFRVSVPGTVKTTETEMAVLYTNITPSCNTVIELQT